MRLHMNKLNFPMSFLLIVRKLHLHKPPLCYGIGWVVVIVIVSYYILTYVLNAIPRVMSRMSNLLSKCACILTKNYLHKFKVQLKFHCSVISETTANNENVLKQWASFYINLFKDQNNLN